MVQSVEPDKKKRFYISRAPHKITNAPSVDSYLLEEVISDKSRRLKL